MKKILLTLIICSTCLTVAEAKQDSIIKVLNE
jgi:hypothetical protein